MRLTKQELAELKAAVWPRDAVRPVNIYAVLDCARTPEIYDLVAKSYRQKACLFSGELQTELERAAPFLLELQPADSVTDEILRRGWNDAWCILIRTECRFASLRRHLRTLLRVRSHDGRFLLFRFYDPRVLGTYLPTCMRDELALVYGDCVSEFFTSSPEAGMTYRFALRDADLAAEPVGTTP